MRQRVVVIVISKERLLVLLRRKPETGTYYVLPGGGIDPGESVRQAVIRELKEESSIDGKPIREVWRRNADGNHEIYWLCEYISGEPQLSYGPEFDRNTETNYYKPMWMPIKSLNEKLYPQELHTLIPKLAE